MAVEKIHLCPYSHSDWAWICQRRWHEKRYIRAFEIALDLMDRGTGFTWFIDSWHEQFAPIRENRPDLVERMKRHVAEGRFGLGPGAFTNPSPICCTREVLIRNFLYGQRKFRELFPGAQFSVASFIDCCAGMSQFPQLAVKMGFSMFSLSRPVEALVARGIPRQFRWRGLDGTEIPCDSLQAYALFCHSPYEQSSVPDYVADQIRQSEQRGCGRSLMLLFGWDDDCLPLGEPCWEHDLFGKVMEWNKSQKAEIKLGIPDDFARDLVSYAGSLPVVEGEMDPIDCSYRMTENCHDNIIDLRLQCAIALGQAELACMHFVPEYPELEIDGLWEELLSLYPHATPWLWEPDHKDFTTRLLAAGRAAMNLRNGARRAAAEQIRPAADGRPIVFFNPIPFDREEACEFFFASDEAGATGYRLTDGKGNELPAQFFADGWRGYGHGEDNKRMRCEYRVTTKVKVPASGYSTAYLRPDNTAEQSARFERAPRVVKSGAVKIEMPNGSIGQVSLDGVGKLLERLDITFVEFEETSASAAQHRSVTLTGQDSDDARWSPAKAIDKCHVGLGGGAPVAVSKMIVDGWSLMESGPLGTRVFMTGSVAGNPVELEMFLRSDDGRMDFELRSFMINPVSGYLFVSLVPAFIGTTNVDIQFGVEPRDMTNEPFGPQFQERGDFKVFWGHSWADYSDGARGVAILAQPGLLGFRVEDGRFEHLLLKTIAPHNVPGRRWANDKRSGLGAERMRFSVLLHAGDWRAARLYREVEKYRQPIDGEDVLYRLQGKEPDNYRGLAVTPDNVMVSAFFIDAGQPVLRIYENEGMAVTARIELPFEADKVTVTDLLCRPVSDTRKISREGKVLLLDLKPWEIVTLALSRK